MDSDLYQELYEEKKAEVERWALRYDNLLRLFNHNPRIQPMSHKSLKRDSGMIRGTFKIPIELDEYIEALCKKYELEPVYKRFFVTVLAYSKLSDNEGAGIGTEFFDSRFKSINLKRISPDGFGIIHIGSYNQKSHKVRKFSFIRKVDQDLDTLISRLIELEYDQLRWAEQEYKNLTKDKPDVPEKFEEEHSSGTPNMDIETYLRLLDEKAEGGV